MNGLPAVMSDETILRPQPSSGGLLQMLPDLLTVHPELDLDANQDFLPVPSAVAKHMSLMVKAQVLETGRNRANAAALLAGNREANPPAIKQWLDALRFFLRWTHLDRNHESDRKLPSDKEIRRFIAVIEDVINVRTTTFFDNRRSINDLLSDINTTVEEDN